MSPELNNTSYIILGMLNIHPRSGYDIKSAADHSTRHFWAISYGQIYPELSRLEGLGYVELESESSAGRARRVFRITPKGRAAVKSWLTAEGGESFELRDELLLKLFFAPDRKTKLQLVRRFKARHLAILATLRAIEERLKTLPHKAGGGEEVLRGGFRFQQAFLDWAETLEKELSANTS